MSDVVIRTESLGKNIAGRDILRDITVDVPPGQVIGLLGKNGAGKSTLIDLLLGFALPTSGRSRVFGEDSATLSSTAKARIGFVPQQDELIGIMTGEQQLDLVASFHEHWDRELIARLATTWEVPLTRRASAMSGGERQKLAALLALGHRPALLVMDEPASGLDPVARRHFMETVLEIASDPGRTVLYSSHIVSDLERAATRLWILREGRMAWQGELDDLKESIVRLHLRAATDLPATLALPGQLACSVAGRVATAIVRGWRPELQRDLEHRTGARIEVEPLGLEDIFLALHA
jgi:ABC-2 type transport system ATP-binding protein